MTTPATRKLGPVLRRPGVEQVARAAPSSPMVPGRVGHRPVAIVDLEASALPPAVQVPRHYGSALVLFRWHGVPVGQAVLPVREGRVPADLLRTALEREAAPRIARRELRRWLGAPEDEAAGPLPSVSVAVCTRDRPEDLARCLAALARLPDTGHEVLVVDSASHGDATRQVVVAHPSVRYVREARPGLDRARNRAMREARHAVVAFTDDDAAVDAGWLTALRARFGDARTLCVTGLTLPLELETPAQVWFEKTNGFGRGFDRMAFRGALMNPFRMAVAGAGVNMALRREVADRIGAFDEALDAGTPTRSGGDHDMFLRILQAGYQIVYEPAALVWHRHRREWAALEDAVRGYGTGVYALLTRHLLQGEIGAPQLALGWLRWQLHALWRAWRGVPGSAPVALHLAELKGCLEGPGAYFRSRRRLTEMARAERAITEAGAEA